MRMDFDQILTHEKRLEIYNLIAKKPGINMTDIMKQTSSDHGVVAYHLKILNKADLITSVRSGLYRCYYDRKTAKDIPESSLERIHYLIRFKPGICQTEISKQLSESRQMVNYHVNQLIRQGKVWYRIDGRKILLFARYNS